MTQRQIFYFYIRLATSVTYLGGRMTDHPDLFFGQNDTKTNFFIFTYALLRLRRILAEE